MKVAENKNENLNDTIPDNQQDVVNNKVNLSEDESWNNFLFLMDNNHDKKGYINAGIPDRDSFHQSRKEFTVKSSDKNFIIEKDLFFSVPKLILESQSIIQAKNIFLFNVENLQCNSSIINAANQLYLPVNAHLTNCTITANMTFFVDKNNFGSVCNDDNYSQIELLKQYCDILGKSIIYEEKLITHEEL
jgi:hypothetical protein